MRIVQRKYVIVGLIFIFLLAFVVRVFNLASVPPSPYLDEVSNGYNAYSLLRTGHDEYGKRFPILMQAYNDGRPALFVYLMIPFIYFFGLNEFAMRFPSVLLSVLATVSIFFLTCNLLYGSGKKRNIVGVNIGLLAALLYAISPWNIYSSRIGDEVDMSVSFFIFGLTFLLFSINKRLRVVPFFLSIVCFVIAFYSYHGIKFFLPFFALGVGVSRRSGAPYGALLLSLDSNQNKRIQSPLSYH